MSVLTPKRAVVFVGFLLVATSLFAGTHPSPRMQVRMAWDAQNQVGVLFGGSSGVADFGTGVPHASDQTWLWNGVTWIQRFPEHNPPSRAAHSMVYETARQQVLLFGGRHEKQNPDDVITLLDDTWAWDGADWTQIPTASAPSRRELAGMAYDSDRNVTVLFGGLQFGADGVTPEPKFDTWEFDGTNWTEVTAGTPPDAIRPLLAYDAVRHEMILIGLKTDQTTVMYRYDAAAHTWSSVTPTTTTPTCVNEASMVSSDTGVLLHGGICAATSTFIETVYTWNGADWTKKETPEAQVGVGMASAWDLTRHGLITYGGLTLGATKPRASTLFYRNGKWTFPLVETQPTPRSLAAFTTDPVQQTIWLFGGLNEFSSGYSADLWGYRNNQWFFRSITGGPSDCTGPLSAYDKNRSKLVVVCWGSTIYEWDGTAWSNPTANVKTAPADRRFAHLAYDETLKKVVLFGGFDGTNYRNDTWLWDGTSWSEIRKERPTPRALASMWYDPLLHKTVLFGGLGRDNLDTRISRFSDMWSFDGTQWTKMSVTTTPGERLGAQITVDPRSGKLLLFGGLKYDQLGENSAIQYYTNDMWQWDGSANSWTKLQPARVPPARENGAMAYDPVADRIVLFAGYSGLFLSDLWSWDGTTWSPLGETFHTRRRSSATPPAPAQP